MIKEIHISSIASIRKPITLSFLRNNIIIGNNCSGKTALCDAISCLYEYKSVYSEPARFPGEHVLLKGLNHPPNHKPIHIERELTVKSNTVVEDTLRINERETLDYYSLSSLLKIIYIRDSILDKVKSENELSRFCLGHLTGWTGEPLSYNYRLLDSLIRRILLIDQRLIEDANWGKNGNQRVKLWEQDFWHNTINHLSHGEFYKLLIEFSILMAESSSSNRPSLVILDGLLNSIDNKGIIAVGKRINSIMNPNIQFIFTTWKKEAADLIDLDCLIELERENGNTTVKISKQTPKGLHESEKLCTRFKEGNEDLFINTIITPLLLRLGFMSLNPIRHHGPGELGIDIGPFIGKGFEWRSSLCGAQVKTAKLTARSGHKNNINILIDQVKTAIANKFRNPSSASMDRLDYIFVFLSQHPTNDALTTFNNAFDGDRRVILLDPSRIAELIWKYGLESV